MSGTPEDVEHISLEQQFGHLLEEARVILPGMQAIFGFQLIAAFNDAFSRKLPHMLQTAHLVATFSTALAVALAMSPAALHRQAEPDRVSQSLIRISTRLLSIALVPLIIGLCIDMFVVSHMVVENEAVGWALAGVLFLFCVGLWYIFPWVRRLKRIRRESEGQPSLKLTEKGA